MTNYLAPDADTSPDYPTRCTSCASPVHRYARFPGGQCLACHARDTPPPATAEEVIAMWQ